MSAGAVVPAIGAVGGFPIDDPQFWVVTVIAAFAAYFLLRPLLPARLGGRRGKSHGTRATLTIGGVPAPGVSAKRETVPANDRA